MAGAERRRLADFIGRRVALSFAALAFAPIFLVVNGAPTAVDMLVFAFSFAPLAAALTAARTGRLTVAHGIAAFGLASLGLIFWIGLGFSAVCALTWLFAAHLETKLAVDDRLRHLASVAGAALLAGIVGGALIYDVKPLQSGGASAVCAAFAFIYGWVVCGGSWDVHRRPNTDALDASTWHAIAEAIDDTVIRFDSTGHIDRVRSDCVTRLGVSSQDLLERGLFEHVHPEDRSALEKMIRTAVDGCDTTNVTLRLKARAGARSSFAVDATESPQVQVRLRRIEPDANDAAGAMPRLVAVLRRVETARAKSIKATSRPPVVTAPQARVVTNLSHELRTPLNAIIGFSEILASRTLVPTEPAKQREYAQIINQSGQHLLSVVNSIIDMSKAQSETSGSLAQSFDVERLPAVEPLEPRMKEVA